MDVNKKDYSSIADKFWKALRDKHIVEKNNCITCINSRAIPGDNHLSCDCPAIVNENRVMFGIFQNLKKEIVNINPTRLEINDIPLQEWDELGIREGYVIFPFNFDPRWLKYCLYYNNKV